jgi:hypothetical protein
MGEQLRRNVQFQHLAAVGAFEGRQQHHHFYVAAEARCANAVQAGEVEEEELLRETEILLQEPVADEGAAGIRQHAFAFGEPDRLQCARGEDDGRDFGFGIGIAHQDLHLVIAQDLVQVVHQVAFAVEVKTQRIERQLGKRDVAGAAQIQAQRVGRLGRANGGREAVGRLPLGAGHFHRPERDVVVGAELAGHPVDRPRTQQRAALQLQALLGRDLFVIHVELDHRHGRNGAQVVGIQNAEQGLGDFRKLVVDFEVDARGQEGEGLQHALDVRVLALVGFKHQAGGDLGVLGGELGAHLAQKRQFPFVVQ